MTLKIPFAHSPRPNTPFHIFASPSVSPCFRCCCPGRVHWIHTCVAPLPKPYMILVMSLLRSSHHYYYFLLRMMWMRCFRRLLTTPSEARQLRRRGHRCQRCDYHLSVKLDTILSYFCQRLLQKMVLLPPLVSQVVPVEIVSANATVAAGEWGFGCWKIAQLLPMLSTHVCSRYF